MRRWLKVLGTLPVWFILFLITFASSSADDCITKRVWDKKEKAYVYYFTCEVAPEVTATPTEPVVDPSPSPSTESPSASAEPTPTLLPTEPVPTPSPDNSEPAPLPTPSETLIDTSIPEVIQLENGVVITVEVKEALQVFDNPVDTVAAAFTDPGKVIKAFKNIGADMRPDVRDTAQKIVISGIIVVQVVGNVATMLVRKM